MDVPTQFQVTPPRGDFGALAFARAMALLVAAGGGAVLFGWHFEISELKQAASHLVAMKPNAAVGLVLTGLALFLLTFQVTRPLARFAGIVLIALGGITVSQDAFGWNLGIDQGLYREPSDAPFTSFLGRMPPATSLSLMLFGAAFVLAMRGRFASAVADLMTGAVLVHALLVLIGYGYGVIALYYSFPFTAMAVHEAMLLIAAAAGIFAASPQRGLAATVVDRSPGGQMIRWILPGIVVVPVFLGWLWHEGVRAGYFDTAVGTALFAVSTIVLLGGFAWLAADVVRRADRDRQRALRELQGQREWLSTTLSSIGDAVIATDGAGAVLVMNRSAETLSGWTLDAARGRPVWEVLRVVDEKTRQPIEDPALKALREQRTLSGIEHVILTRDGAPVPVEVSAAPIMGPDGIAAGAVVTFHDVIDRRRFEQRQRMLMSELNHRVKNVLAIVQSLVSASARHAKGKSVEGMARTLGERLQALGRAHELLLETQWSGASLKAMVERELAPYRRGTADGVTVEGPDVLLPPQSTSVMAMTLHELATNAVKYGALSKPEGKLSVAWRQDGETLNLVWSERAPRPVAAPKTRKGLGMQLIDRGIGQNLGGTTKVEFRPEGLHVEIALPMTGSAPDEAPPQPQVGALSGKEPA